MVLLAHDGLITAEIQQGSLAACHPEVETQLSPSEMGSNRSLVLRIVIKLAHSSGACK